jgi:hypothetical protein
MRQGTGAVPSTGLKIHAPPTTLSANLQKLCSSASVGRPFPRLRLLSHTKSPQSLRTRV